MQLKYIFQMNYVLELILMTFFQLKYKFVILLLYFQSCLYIISNFADSNPYFIQFLIYCGLIDAVFDVMDKFSDKIPELFGWTIYNFFTNANPKQVFIFRFLLLQIKIFVSEKPITKICQLLMVDIYSVKICMLISLTIILEVYFLIYSDFCLGLSTIEYNG